MIISQLIDKLDYDGTHLTGSTYEAAVTLVRYAESIISNITDLENSISILCERIGTYHQVTGNLNKALAFFEKYNQLEKELYDSYPDNVSFKNGLAISYEKLGSTHSSLGNLNKALEFFEQFTQLMKELYDSYPDNVSFKNGLAISYYKLAQYYQAMNNHLKAIDNFRTIKPCRFSKPTRFVKQYYETKNRLSPSFCSESVLSLLQS